MDVVGNPLADIDVVVEELVVRGEGPAEVEAMVPKAGGEFVVVSVVTTVGIGGIKRVASYSRF